MSTPCGCRAVGGRDLTADEIAYILNDCEAKVLVAETRLPAIMDAVARCGV